MAHTRNTVKGHAYESVEAMPADVRRLYEETLRQMGPGWEDRDGSGVPDRFEGRVELGGLSATAAVESRIVVNGRTYGSAAEMPADVRRMFDDAMAAAKRGGAEVTRTRTERAVLRAEVGGHPAKPGPATPGRSEGPRGSVEVSFSIPPWMLIALALLGAGALLWVFAGH